MLDLATLLMRLQIALLGSCPAPTRVECGDLPASEATPGRVRLGEYSTGTLDDASDRDWFRIDGLEHYRQYRLEVDFLGANVVGGSLDIFSSRLGEPVVARSDLWDSNYGGHAVLDFWPVAVGISTMYVQVESDNDMNREGDGNRYTGPYTITLSELPDVQRMVSNLEQRASDRLTFYNLGHLHEDGLTGHVKEMAIDFTTGSHAAGYTLDKLAAYISMGPPYRHGGYRHDHRRFRRQRCHWDPGLRRRRRQDVDGARRRHDRRELQPSS